LISLYELNPLMLAITKVQICTWIPRVDDVPDARKEGAATIATGGSGTYLYFTYATLASALPIVV
jgi:hypothetical protein